MKNSKDYAKKVQKLYRSLKRQYPKAEPVFFEDPADAVVYGVVSENLKGKAAQAAMKRFGGYFVDLNDLRAARMEEVVEMLGSDTTATRDIASILSRLLNGIFNKYHKMSLEALKKEGKRPAKVALEKMDGISRFVVDFCMLTSFQGHAIPLTATMVEYLKSNDLVHPDANEQTIEGFLGKQISAKDGYDFYLLLRHESESKISKKTTRKKRTTKTAAKDRKAAGVTKKVKKTRTKTATKTKKTVKKAKKTARKRPK